MVGRILKNALVEKIISSPDQMYDTKNYRYVWNPETRCIYRIAIECVGRTSYLDSDNWELCVISKKFKVVK